MVESQTQCPHCGFAYVVPPEQAAAMAGQSFACTNCGRTFTLAPGGALAQPSVQHVAYASGAHVKSNPLAIASLICGCILCLPFVPGIAAIVTGALGMRKAKDPAVTGKGMAIAGLVLGIVNVLGWAAYVALIASIMFPSLGRARETANRVKCASNLRQIGLAVAVYADENGGRYPDTIEQLVLTQDLAAEVFVCPSTGATAASGANPQAVHAAMTAGTGHVSYIYVGKGMTSNASAEAVVAYEPLSNHGSGNAGANVLFGDGHVEFLTKPRVQRMMKQLEAGENPPNISAAASRTSPAVEADR